MLGPRPDHLRSVVQRPRPHRGRRVRQGPRTEGGRLRPAEDPSRFATGGVPRGGVHRQRRGDRVLGPTSPRLGRPDRKLGRRTANHRPPSTASSRPWSSRHACRTAIPRGSARTSPTTSTRHVSRRRSTLCWSRAPLSSRPRPCWKTSRARWRKCQSRDEYAYLPPEPATPSTRARFAVRPICSRRTPQRRSSTCANRLISAAFKAGVPVLLGSDSPQIFNVPGFSIHHELQAMAEAGLTPFEAIATGTIAPAEFYGQDHLWGSIAPGRSADLIVLRDDPLADIGNTRSIDAVMVRGTPPVPGGTRRGPRGYSRNATAPRPTMRKLHSIHHSLGASAWR